MGDVNNQPQPQVQVQRTSHLSYGRLIPLAVIAVLGIILILQNTGDNWQLHVLFWRWSLPAALMLTLVFAVGFAAGLVVSVVLRYRRQRRHQK